MKILVILFCLINLSCVNQSSHTHSKNIKDFVNNIILSNTSNTNDIFEYIEASEELRSKEGFEELLENYVTFLRESLVSQKREYQVTRHLGNEDQEGIVKYNLQYNDLENVYYIISEEKIVTHIIMDNDKIISFFCSISKRGNQNFPVMLNTTEL